MNVWRAEVSIVSMKTWFRAFAATATGMALAVFGGAPPPARVAAQPAACCCDHSVPDACACDHGNDAAPCTADDSSCPTDACLCAATAAPATALAGDAFTPAPACARIDHRNDHGGAPCARTEPPPSPPPIAFS